MERGKERIICVLGENKGVQVINSQYDEGKKLSAPQIPSLHVPGKQNKGPHCRTAVRAPGKRPELCKLSQAEWLGSTGGVDLKEIISAQGSYIASSFLCLLWCFSQDSVVGGLGFLSFLFGWFGSFSVWFGLGVLFGFFFLKAL